MTDKEIKKEIDRLHNHILIVGAAGKGQDRFRAFLEGWVSNLKMQLAPAPRKRKKLVRTVKRTRRNTRN